MPNTIIYNASSDDAINECAYSLLKYLAVYNLKPPVDHVLRIHTHKPASLEVYGSFFNRFELRESLGKAMDPDLLKSRVAGTEGNILFMGSSAYPISLLDPMFEAMKRGEVFISRSNLPGRKGSNTQIFHVIGFNNHQSFDLAGAGGKDPSGFITQYSGLTEFTRFLRYFFKRYQEESVPNQVKLLQHIDACKISEEKRNFIRLPIYKQLIWKMTGKAFNIRQFTGKL